jgi:hypothetical protein
MLSQTTVGWLLLAAGPATLGLGVLVRVFVGRRTDWPPVRRVVGGFRSSRFAEVLLGPVRGEPLDGDELDSMFLMPTFIVGCGLCLTALFLLGYDSLV